MLICCYKGYLDSFCYLAEVSNRESSSNEKNRKEKVNKASSFLTCFVRRIIISYSITMPEYQLTYIKKQNFLCGKQDI